MPFYQLSTDVSEDKIDEFVRSVRSLWIDFLKDENCANFRVYRDFENATSFCLIGEFDSHESMAKHFRTRKFKVLLGATQVLGRSFKLTIAEIKKQGGYELAVPGRDF
jgi:quinol monooxygenase YgiN